MKKRILSLLLTLCLLLSAIPFLPMDVAAEGSGANNTWFREQLADSTAQAFYTALERMEADGTLKTGTGAYDLTANGLVSAETVSNYLGAVGGVGTDRLLNAYGAARDAYYMDHPDVFYVDFSNLTVSIVNVGGEHHVVLGAGRTKTYYTYGFEDAAGVEAAIERYNEALQKAVAAADGKTTDEDKILAVHNYITMNTSYRKEGEIKPENLGNIRTAYGSLVNREGVCEAYTRAFKAAMDELGYPCIMVSGVYIRPDGSPEQHIWNYVQLSGDNGTHWYMVDVTMDDPTRADKKETDGVDGFEGTEYFLVGRRTEQRNHVPNGVVSASNYTFRYPALAAERYGTVDLSDENIPGLHVRYAKVPVEGIDGGGYSVDYNGKSAIKMREDGFYLLVRFFDEDTDMAEDGTEYSSVRDSGWIYAIPEMYPYNSFYTDDGTETFFALPQTKYVQFAVTDVWTAQELVDYLNAGVGTSEGAKLLDQQYYKGDSAHLLAETAVYENANGDYTGCPYVIPTDEYVNGRFYIDEGVQVMELTYDDILKPIDSEQPITLDFRCENISDEVQDYNSGKENSTLHSYEFINDYEKQRTTVRFEFTPSKMWIDDSVLYVFTIRNAVGVSSDLAPMEFQFPATHRGAPCCMWRSGIDLNVYGKPKLLDDVYQFDSSWATEGGDLSDLAEYDSEALRDRMVLVVDDPSARESHDMDAELSAQTEQNVLGQKSYNISLLVCNRKTLTTGKRIRLMLGFPDGYGPGDEGVTFKAYHFTRDENDNVNGVEEIPCVITKYGLLVTCNSFSPFTVVAVEKTEEDNTVQYVLTTDGSGTVSADNGVEEGTDGTVVTLGEGESANVQVQAAEGYVISGLSVGQNVIAEAAGQESYLLKLENSAPAAVSEGEPEAEAVGETEEETETYTEAYNEETPVDPETLPEDGETEEAAENTDGPDTADVALPEEETQDAGEPAALAEDAPEAGTAPNSAAVVTVTFMAKDAVEAVEAETNGTVETIVMPETASEPLENPMPEPTPDDPPAPSTPVPTETSTPSAEPTQTPVPTETPTPSAEPTQTPIPTETPAPSAEPTQTPVPTETPAPSAEPTQTPASTETPAPSTQPTPAPEPTDEPTAGILAAESKTDGYRVEARDISAENKAAFDSVIGTQDGVVYADVVLIDEKTGQEAKGQTASVLFRYPEDVKDPKAYVFTLYHGTDSGQVEVIPEGDKLTVRDDGLLYTGTFSPFALKYAKKDAPKPAETAVPSPSTGDQRNFTPLIIAMCVGGAGVIALVMVLLLRRRRR